MSRLTFWNMSFAKAAEHLDGDELDLGALLIPYPERSMLYRMPDGSLRAQGIEEGDLVVVERARQARPGELGLVSMDGASVLRRLDRGLFQESNDSQATIEFQGTATLLIRQLT